MVKPTWPSPPSPLVFHASAEISSSEVKDVPSEAKESLSRLYVNSRGEVIRLGMSTHKISSKRVWRVARPRRFFSSSRNRNRCSSSFDSFVNKKKARREGQKTKRNGMKRGRHRWTIEQVEAAFGGEGTRAVGRLPNVLSPRPSLRVGKVHFKSKSV
jgi:hypothetical protein